MRLVNRHWLVFEEFHSKTPIGATLNYLDIYPLMFSARYNDLVACYTKLHLTSSIPLEKQHRDIQRYQLESWRAEIHVFGDNLPAVIVGTVLLDWHYRCFEKNVSLETMHVMEIAATTIPHKNACPKMLIPE